MALSWLEIGLQHLRERRLNEAVALLRQAMGAEPGRVAPVRALATALLLKGDVAAARAALAAFVRDHPACTDAWQLAAQLEWKLGDRPAAVQVLRRAVAAVPNSAAIRQQLNVFLAAEGGSSAVPLASVLGQAHGNLTVADDDWLDRAAADPKVLDSLLRLPMQLYDERMFRRLEAKLAARLAEQPNHADRHLALAQVRARLGSADAALAGAQRAMELNPRYSEAYRLAAEIHEQAGRPGRAIQVLRALVKQGVRWPDILNRLAELERRASQVVRAQAA